MKSICVIVLFLLVLLSCDSNKNEAQGNWIKGSPQQQIQAIERQFRGFDNAMFETGYRYQELYWAGQDENWEYAGYQLEKIETAIRNGLERRPKRTASAQHFLTRVLPEMKEAVESKDSAIFTEDFTNMTINCNNCHAMEKVPFFTVKIPTERQSPIRK